MFVVAKKKFFLLSHENRQVCNCLFLQYLYWVCV